jgi:hypothetical protein
MHWEYLSGCQGAYSIHFYLLTDKPGCGAMLGWKGMSETKARAYLPSHDLQKEAFFRLPGNVFNTFFINLQIS